jgi:hypothetical protein
MADWLDQEDEKGTPTARYKVNINRIRKAHGIKLREDNLFRQHAGPQGPAAFIC